MLETIIGIIIILIISFSIFYEEHGLKHAVSMTILSVIVAVFFFGNGLLCWHI